MQPTSYNILSEHTIKGSPNKDVNVLRSRSKKHKRIRELETISPIHKKSPKVLTHESYVKAMKEFQELRLRLGIKKEKK